MKGSFSLLPKNNEFNLFKLKWGKIMLVTWFIWCLIAFGFTVRSSIYQLSVGQPVYWLHIFLYNFNSSMIWFLLTPLMGWLSFHIGKKPNAWTFAIASHLGMAVSIGLVHTSLFLLLDFLVQNRLNLWLSQMTLTDYYNLYFWELLVEAILTYGIVIGLILGYIYYLKNQQVLKTRAQLEKSLLKSKIANLKYQFQPHFLFNSLQIVSNLMHRDVKLADNAIAELGDMLRFSINQLESELTPLNTELEMAKKYISIQSLRFPGRLKYQISVPDELLDCLVPAFMLQPLLENSIKYGIEHKNRRVEIQIDAKLSNDYIVIRITDDGPGVQPGTDMERSGTGISNLINRLEGIYSLKQLFNLTSSAKGTQIQIQIPINLSDEAL